MDEFEMGVYRGERTPNPEEFARTQLHSWNSPDYKDRILRYVRGWDTGRGVLAMMRGRDEHDDPR
jgi:hypothetical protein